jgi:dihydropteroate synthase
MITRPVSVPASLVSDLPPLRGQRALRILAVQDMDRHTTCAPRPFDPVRDAALARAPADLCGRPLSRPQVMGILNTTPDSFSDGGKFNDLTAALSHARAMVDAGADILDIGGESTRPGATEVPVADEIARTAPLIRALRAEGITVPLSIDTRKARVVDAALAAGADFVNDVSALTWDRDLARVVADAGVPICLMHAQGTPQTMQDNPFYSDVRFDVLDWLAQAIDRAGTAGISRDRILVDPGIGFGKTHEHNLALLQNLSLLHATGCGILIGISRKRMIGALTGVVRAEERVHGSVAAAMLAAGQGAQILRVHDVAATRQALSVWESLCGARVKEQE